MKSILIKEIDVLTSKTHKNKQVSEFLIYLCENDIKLNCYSEFGIYAKNLRVNELIAENKYIDEIIETNLKDNKI